MLGPIEYGDACAIVNVGRFPTPTTLSHKATSRRSNYGMAIQGFATRYNQPLIHDNKLKVLLPGALDASIKSGKRIRFLLDHDDKLECGCTDTNLQLLTDANGVAFRLRLSESELAHHARTLAEAKLYTAMSIGYFDAKYETKYIDGYAVQYIYSAHLGEISFLKAGAVRTTHAELCDTRQAGSLLEETKNGKFLSDGSFAVLIRALQNVA